MLEVFIGFALYALTNKKRHAELHRMKVWGGRGFAVSRKRESYGKNLLKQIDDRRHFEFWKNNEYRLCRVLAPYAPTNKKRHAELRVFSYWWGR